MKPDICIGITTWNSALFLPTCLMAVRQVTPGLRVQLEVVDNRSCDGTPAIAAKHGARVRSTLCSQILALNMLLRTSRAPVTLLMHADVVLLSPDWYAACARRLVDNVALVSPEDIGCGPLTRPYGRGKPESCFLLFDTAKVRHCMEWKLRPRFRVPWPERHLHLEAAYVTHDLPQTLATRGYTWHAMRVHASPELPGHGYVPPFIPEYWDDRLGRLRYAMGNFYSLDGCLTHYHNWYDRVGKDVPEESRETTEGEGRGLPVAFLSAGSRRFLSDFAAGQVRLPDVGQAQPEPRATTRHVPDLGRPWPPSGPSSTA